MPYSFDAVVALAGDFSPEGDLGESTLARMDVAIDLVRSGLASRMIVSGSHSFISKPPERPSAHLMQDYVIEKGVPSKDIYVQDQSVDTVGDALFTKEEFTEPQNWKRLAVVTNRFHLPRSESIFNHVMGPEYTIEGFAAPDRDFPLQGLHEWCAGLLTKAVLAKTEAGDTDAIQYRLFSIVPGYASVPVRKRLAALATAII